jgi:hypothetical protein
MLIHKLNKSTLGGRSVFGHKRRNGGGGGSAMKVASHQRRTMGTGLRPEIFEDGQVKRASEVLRNLKIKPKVPRKYISFE